MGYVDREKKIEDLLCEFPSLFDIPADYQIFRQHKYLDGSQADVVFRWAKSSLVVEVKNDPLCLKDLKQLRDYLVAEEKERETSDVRGLLLGRIPTRAETLERTIREWGLKVEIRYLESDFMLQACYCRNCKQPFWPSCPKCPHCSARDHITIDFAAD